MQITLNRRVIRLLFAGGIVLGLVFSMFLYSRFEVWAIKNQTRFQREVGYTLPEHVNIPYTEANIFSLADGPNYLWLITSESSLIPWVEQLGWRIGLGQAGWSHVRSFYEVAPYEKNFEQLTLDSVWRVFAHSPKGRDETSYIFIAGNHRVALIKTFRP